ncbi:CPBP family intramembrane glutamic endopeptidase [Lentilactobacillus hilgardii]|uniref:CPBP family intramembrane metalloprotease n=1 Tax=Lentilactobacillus hilgardii TaxID=1588 RepID=A0A6P1E248_LENHI|nr:CPBP family intramembrane glutamic endopeptidase [Lentilactobacillus hilgardii]EEI71763.1 CAAX amino terminal protease family protein [Lentilactobacillus hilgardii ATCC 27305]MCT3393129.1 CPBP family intramembrane metalloprotease [Lentilactobacillus hilgardii]QHB51386.1 CPBP family intramembrane metalloprotease [Lentilactobacillus hilgardii]RRG10311.1 MAG: CPBP family intramembrane metalloprotease [Lactobacillus sp.]
MNKSTSRYIWEIIGLIVVEDLIIFNPHYVLDPFNLSEAGAIAAQEIISFVIFVLINIFIVKVKINLIPTVSWGRILILAVPIYIVIVAAVQRIVTNTHLDVPLGITVGLGAGIFEEFFYRGLILGTLMRLFSKQTSKARQIWYPLLITSLIFGLDHSTNAFSQPAINTLFQVIQSFTLALIMGALYIRPGSLMMSILFHGIWDFVGSVAVGSVLSTTTVNATFIVSNLVLDLILFSGAWFYLRAKKIPSIRLDRFYR